MDRNDMSNATDLMEPVRVAGEIQGISIFY